MTTIKVVVTEDDFFSREGICGILEQEPDISVIGRASNGQAGLDLVRELKPDVLLLDIRMPPGIDGLEVIHRLRAEGNKVLIIALTQETRVVRAVEKEGGNGFVPKDKYQMLIHTVRCVARTRSNLYINPEISQEFRDLTRRVEEARLSELELSVWALIAFKNEEISRRLHKAVGRIRNIVTELYFKLDIQDEGKVSQRIQAMELARLYGVLHEPEHASS